MIVKYKTEITKEKLPTLAVETAFGTKYIHSRHFPSKESKMFPDINTSSKSAVIILGLGLGHHLSAKNFNPENCYIIIDVIDKIEDETIRIYPGLKQKFIHLITGDENWILHNTEHILKQFAPSGISIIEHTASVRAFPEEYERIKSSISGIINSMAGNTATRNFFASAYLKNIIRRLPELGTCHPVASLKNRFRGLAAVVVSSAPSLDSDIAGIKLLSDSVILIAVDSALPPLAAHGICPDFVISIDPQPWITEHLNGITCDFSLIESISSFNNSLTQKKFVSLNTHPVAQIIEHLYPGKTGSVDSGTGTVTGDAINAALLMGCDPVFVSGMDFCFPDFNIYARGTSYQNRFTKIFNNRIMTAESFNADYIFRKSRNYKYNEINSRRSFIDYRNRLNKFIASKNTEFIHCGEKSIHLDMKVINNCSQIINNLSPFPESKKDLFSTIENNFPLMNDVINFDKLYSFIRNPDHFNEICHSSEITDKQKKKKYFRLQEKLCGSV